MLVDHGSQITYMHVSKHYSKSAIVEANEILK